MKKMLGIKYKMALYGVMAALLMVGMERVARSDDKPAVDLLPQTILVRSQESYDSLTSYSDTGKTVVLSNNNFCVSFKTKLARPSLYRIEWEYPSRQGAIKVTGVIWSAGEGDFRVVGNASIKEKNRRSAFIEAMGDSGLATQTIPGIFFKTDWGTLLESFGANVKRESDEKLGDIDCYVLLADADKVKRTLWIGKKDFLIHQIRHETIGELSGVSMEIHSDIAVNQKFVPNDFSP